MSRRLPQVRGRPFILGLTGSIGMGKSTVAAMFREIGVPVFDADAAVHAMQRPGGALVAVIEAEFPGSTGAMGVDRAALGRLVFADQAALARLEAIVHPAVATRREAFLRENADSPLIVFDIPLLYERGSDQIVDAVAVVSAPPEVQRARVLARAGMTPEKFESILGLQIPDEEKRRRADFVIDAGLSPSETRDQVERIAAALSRMD